MANGYIQNGFPAGDESDESDAEWDIGYSHKQNTNEGVVKDEPATPDGDKVSTFKRAINTGDIKVVEQLLDNGVEVDTRLGFDWTPLMYAVHAGNYDMAQLLLDRGASANFSKDLYTVLMAACTASVPEGKIIKCVELLLTRNADSNAANKSHMTSLMMAAREGHTQVINLLVSSGAEINAQDDGGHTALIIAVQYNREEAVLKLLQLGADKTLKARGGKTAADFATQCKRPQIARFLASQSVVGGSGDEASKQDNLFKFFNRRQELVPTLDSSAKLCDIELLLHGLNLGYLADVIIEHDITWGELLAMERQDLEKIGITDPEDQTKVLCAVQEMHLDRVDFNTLTQLENVDSGSEELYTFLISLRQQCCYLTDTVRDVISRFPRSASELVLTWDPKKEAQGICSELVAQTEDLQKEVTCLRDLLRKMDPADFPGQPARPSSHGRDLRRWLKTLARGMLGGAGLFGVGMLGGYLWTRRYGAA
ncbi:ankyrin repeat, SAM and basic leucine zipper domain-containing protein 1 [Engraulis encrasicolus]|uniref:ankyrin repeat, SAM and basic leucine zipper domain-containing protein 1 n=1 Tax=Engraulis encrasicolus TaxID=184585 RepID=UPI002FCFA813